MVAFKISNYRARDQYGEWTLPLPEVSGDEGGFITVTEPRHSTDSLLAKYVAGIADAKNVEGEIKIAHQDVRDMDANSFIDKVSYVPSNPYLMFSGIKTTLIGEIDLSYRISKQDGLDIEDIVNCFKLRDLRYRNPFDLSGGEAMRAAFALACIKQPELLVLDQVFDNLHPEWSATLVSLLDKVLPRTSIVLSVQLSNNNACFELNATCDDNHWQTCIQTRNEAKRTFSQQWNDHSSLWVDAIPLSIAHQSQVSLKTRNLQFSYGSNGFQFGPLNFDLAMNEAAALVGPNGSGKTTLLKCLALLLIPKFEELIIINKSGKMMNPPPIRLQHTWASVVRYAFQQPEDQLFRATTRQEITQDLTASISEKTREFLQAAGLCRVLDHSALDQPRSIQKMITFAAALEADAPILLLDEPTAGLNAGQAEAVVNAISQANNTTVLVVSHDRKLLQTLPRKSLPTSENNSSIIKAVGEVSGI